jgi:hypothetical protein
VSSSTVRRWLASDALEPWQHRSWIFPAMRGFAVKASERWICTRVFDGEPIGEHGFARSADEKSGVHARSRI